MRRDAVIDDGSGGAMRRAGFGWWALLGLTLIAATPIGCAEPPLEVEGTRRYLLRGSLDQIRQQLEHGSGGQLEIAELSPSRLRMRVPGADSAEIELREREGVLTVRSLFSEAAPPEVRQRAARVLRRLGSLAEVGPRVDVDGLPIEGATPAAPTRRLPANAAAGAPVANTPATTPARPPAPPRRPRERPRR